MDKIEAIYIGRRMTSQGKIAHGFIRQVQIDSCKAFDEQRRTAAPGQLAEEIERKASLFALKRSPGGIGCIYNFEGRIEDGRIVSISGDPAFVRENSGNEGLYSAWWAASDAVDQTVKRQSAERKADADRALTHAIAVLNDRYLKIAPAYRRGFKLWLLEQIEKR